MKLRKTRKAPKRYDDYEWEEEDQEEVRATIPSPKARARPTFRLQPDNPPYNPNLSPASFPTLDFDVPCKANSTAVRPSHGTSPKSLVINTNIRNQIEWLRNRQLEAQKPERPSIPIPPPYEIPPGFEPGSIYGTSFRTEAQSNRAETIWPQDHLRSDVYLRNMEILERMANMTDDDWNILEMMTSDEEASSRAQSSQLSKVRHAKLRECFLCANIPVCTDRHAYTNSSRLCILGRTLGRPPTGFASYTVRDLRNYHRSNSTVTS